MLEELIRNFYGKDGYLKDEANIRFTQEAMKKIIIEFANLKFSKKSNSGMEEI